MHGTLTKVISVTGVLDGGLIVPRVKEQAMWSFVKNWTVRIMVVNSQGDTI